MDNGGRPTGGIANQRLNTFNSVEFKDVHVTQDLTVDGEHKVENLSVTGNAGVDGNLAVDGIAEVGELVSLGQSDLQQLQVYGESNLVGEVTMDRNFIVNGYFDTPCEINETILNFHGSGIYIDENSEINTASGVKMFGHVWNPSMVTNAQSVAIATPSSWTTMAPTFQTVGSLTIPPMTFLIGRTGTLMVGGTAELVDGTEMKFAVHLSEHGAGVYAYEFAFGTGTTLTGAVGNWSLRIDFTMVSYADAPGNSVANGLFTCDEESKPSVAQRRGLLVTPPSLPYAVQTDIDFLVKGNGFGDVIAVDYLHFRIT